MAGRLNKIRILLVTPEISFLPQNMGKITSILNTKAGGLADVSSLLVEELYQKGIDIHVAIPHYRRIFGRNPKKMGSNDLRFYYNHYEEGKIHFAEDRGFLYQDSVYDESCTSVLNFSLAFQRELTNHIIRNVKPDIVHCNDWTTGLIPPFTRRLGIRSLLTIHNIYTKRATLSEIEEKGIDAPIFWENLYFEDYTNSYEEARDRNRVDFLTSGIFSANMINTVSPQFLREIVDGWHNIPDPVRSEIRNKYWAGSAFSILNAPHKSYDPAADPAIRPWNYSYDGDIIAPKQALKADLQQTLGLRRDPGAPLFFWPSRLDPTQKGCELLSRIFFPLLESPSSLDLQIVIVANGPYFDVFRSIINFHQISDRAVLCPFEDSLSRRAYAASDFILMPSRYEPCGLAQMIAQKYGSLPIAMYTGGLINTVEHLDWENHTGSGFIFKDYNPDGLWWGILEALRFYRQEAGLRESELRRVMKMAGDRYSITAVADQYIELYEELMGHDLF